MSAGVNLIGQKFHRLLVIEKAFIKNRAQYWRCLCECGEYAARHTTQLRLGRIKSCGCALSPNIVGKRFSRLIVLGKSENRIDGAYQYWECLCDCGKKVIVKTSSLNNGNTKSCGCLMVETASKTRRKHGLCLTTEYSSWEHMMQRCYNKNHDSYGDYGGRGIVVCPEWRNSFETFLADMGQKPSADLSIDRHPNVNGNYEPLNCRWGTVNEQARGKRNNRWYKYGDKKMVVSDWSRLLNVSQSTIVHHAGNEIAISKETFDALKKVGDRNTNNGLVVKQYKNKKEIRT